MSYAKFRITHKEDDLAYMLRFSHEYFDVSLHNISYYLDLICCVWQSPKRENDVLTCDEKGAWVEKVGNLCLKRWTRRLNMNLLTSRLFFSELYEGHRGVTTPLNTPVETGQFPPPSSLSAVALTWQKVETWLTAGKWRRQRVSSREFHSVEQSTDARRGPELFRQLSRMDSVFEANTLKLGQTGAAGWFGEY